MTLLNIIGITRFVQLGPMALAVGVLPYPLTFLCTDLICELYGRARANFLVTVGLGLNFFILGVLLLGNTLPAVPAESMPPWQILQLAAPVLLVMLLNSLVEGFVTRTMPQMNIMVLGLPLRVTLGMFGLLFMMPAVVHALVVVDEQGVAVEGALLESLIHIRDSFDALRGMGR